MRFPGRVPRVAFNPAVCMVQVEAALVTIQLVG